MSVNSQHPDYREYIGRWTLVRDVVNSKVKAYIKDIDGSDKARCERYRDDARFTNFTGRTKNGLVGAVYRKEVEISLPESVEYLKHDATGSKMGLSKLAQEITGEVLQAGRYGLLVDFPASEEGLTAAEVADMNLKARISKYKAESIINWQTTVVNGIHTLTMVVLCEEVSCLGDDGFTWISEKQYRVLRLEENVYVQQLYNERDQLIHQYVPRDFEGNAWEFIPFVFVGAEDNDAEIDAAPLYDLAALNIGHLRNSADYEESVHITGQPTLIISTEMSAEQFNAANPGGVQIGARRGHNLGPGGNAQMLQADPNQLADVAMQRKEQQAVMIGARLVMQAGSNETAEAARIKHSGENSVLATIVGNVNNALLQCIEWCVRFMSKQEVSSDDITFEISRQFFDTTVDPQMLLAQLQLFNNGIIGATDIRHTLRTTGAIKSDRSDQDIEEDIGSINPFGEE